MRPTGHVLKKKKKKKHTTWPRAYADGPEGAVTRQVRPYHSRAVQSENWKSVSGLLPSAGWLGCSVFVGVVLP